ncbi:hypothetical protein AVEN_266424-1 [Araneus ventricosus]|uniref:Uncharacterized protein n=1 Tax=Araneus ventricosus TaxID=182803 RepID=A0A4Y2JY22_ARAVE|nr:hypothetical protein AVEN_266424-1 [Araneus ventricosus]
MIIGTKKIAVKEKTLDREINSKIRIMIILLTEDIDHDVISSVCLPLSEVEINCELGHIRTKAAVVTNDPGRYVLGNKTARLFKDEPFLNLEKVNDVLTQSQAKRSSEEDRRKEPEMEQP